MKIHLQKNKKSKCAARAYLDGGSFGVARREDMRVIALIIEDHRVNRVRMGNGDVRSGLRGGRGVYPGRDDSVLVELEVELADVLAERSRAHYQHRLNPIHLNTGEGKR